MYLVLLNDMKSLIFFSIGRSSHKYTQRMLTLVYFILNAFWFEAEIQSSRRRRTDILDVGESTRRRNDRNSFTLLTNVASSRLRLHLVSQNIISLLHERNASSVLVFLIVIGLRCSRETIFGNKHVFERSKRCSDKKVSP